MMKFQLKLQCARVVYNELPLSGADAEVKDIYIWRLQADVDNAIIYTDVSRSQIISSMLLYPVEF